MASRSVISRSGVLSYKSGAKAPKARAHLNVWVVGEVLDHAVSVFHGHGAVQLDALDPRLLQPEVAQVKHARELAEHQALRGRVVLGHQRNLLALREGRK